MTTVRASATLAERSAVRARSWSIGKTVVAPATMIVIIAAALLLLMTPLWTHFALDASGGALALGTAARSYELSDRTVSELLVGPGTFVSFAADEAAHLRDVRLVLLVFIAIALVSLAVVFWNVARRSRDPQTWRSIARGGLALAAAVVVIGVFAALAFGVAFELFHRLLFPGGNWAFPPESLLIRLYPYGFWQLTAAAFAVLAIGGGALTWFVATRRARSLETDSRA